MKIYQTPAIVPLGTVAEQTLATSVVYYPKGPAGADMCKNGEQGQVAANCIPQYF